MSTSVSLSFCCLWESSAARQCYCTRILVNLLLLRIRLHFYLVIMHVRHCSCIPERYRQNRDSNPTLKNYLPEPHTEKLFASLPRPLGNYCMVTYTVIIQILPYVWLGCGLMYDWTHHKFMELNILRIDVTVCYYIQRWILDFTVVESSRFTVDREIPRSVIEWQMIASYQGSILHKCLGKIASFPQPLLPQVLYSSRRGSKWGYRLAKQAVKNWR